jgi:hypothetical protein
MVHQADISASTVSLLEEAVAEETVENNPRQRVELRRE